MVLPDLRYTDGMKYPDPEALGPRTHSGVPRFKLLKLETLCHPADRARAMTSRASIKA
jgi:hypothetical protein